MTKEQIKQRNNAIALSAIYDHLTLAAIGKKYGISRERVRQILKAMDIDFTIVRLRRQNQAKAYSESLRAAKARCATTLPDGRKTPEYQAYRNMLNRCLNTNCPAYPEWGGRGIKVCDRWLGKVGFETFLMDMGPRPEGKYPCGRAMYSIHRINNDGNYEPGNCEWADQKKQCANRRKPNRNTKVSDPVMQNVNNTGTSGQQPDL